MVPAALSPIQPQTRYKRYGKQNILPRNKSEFLDRTMCSLVSIPTSAYPGSLDQKCI